MAVIRDMGMFDFSFCCLSLLGAKWKRREVEGAVRSLSLCSEHKGGFVWNVVLSVFAFRAASVLRASSCALCLVVAAVVVVVALVLAISDVIMTQALVVRSPLPHVLSLSPLAPSLSAPSHSPRFLGSCFSHSTRIVSCALWFESIDALPSSRSATKSAPSNEFYVCAMN